MEDLIEVKGVIIKIISAGNKFRDNSKNFLIKTLKSEKEYNVYANFYCPIEVGDIVVIIGKESEDRSGHITITRMPMTYIGVDTKTVTNCLESAFKCYNYKPQYFTLRAKTVKEYIENMANDSLGKSLGERINDLLVELADEYQFRKSAKTLATFNSILNDKETQTLLRWWFKHRAIRRLYLLNINLSEIRESMMTTSKLYELVMTNPFSVPYIGLTRANEIQKILNREVDDLDLMYGGILRWVYRQCWNNNWDYVPQDDLIRQYRNLKKEDIISLIDNYNLVFEEDRVYFKFGYEAEIYIAEKLSLLKNIEEKEPIPINQEYFSTFSPDQLDAINSVLKNRVVLIRGKAGTGKTHILAKLTDFLYENKKKILIVSFTGKAVSRVKQQVNSNLANITTIHRFFSSYETDYVYYDYIFVDESSMVNTVLFYKLLRLLDIGKNNYYPHIIFIGDNFQLPPINWSSLFDNLIESNKFVSCELTKIYRTAELETNGIFINSNEIREWHKDKGGLQLRNFDNFQLIDGDLNRLKSIIASLLSIDGITLDDMVIIHPYKEVDELNEIMRNHLTSKDFVVDHYNKKWSVGDRVMLTKNNYDIDVMNGDEGKIVALHALHVVVEFNQNGKSKLHKFKLDKPKEEEVKVDDESFSELCTKYLLHSFAYSTHRSQGSERKIVIFYLPGESNSTFINRNLLYVAITRASKLFIMVGNVSSFRIGAITSLPKKYLSLKDRFQ